MTDVARASRLASALVGRYDVGRELGAGGMATVYIAYDVRHQRSVALKVLRSELSETLVRERFLREIRMAARLTHPHILPLYDSGEADGYMFFVMPVMEGQTLRERLTSESPLPVDVATRIALEVADALDYAHRHDIVHRDIKPENILLHEGHAVVADFGIGKAIMAATNASKTLTGIGITVGTPAYVSPEQASGDTVDGRSDLFSLGCVFYEMLTGEQAFTGMTPQAIIASRYLYNPPPVIERRSSISPDLSQAVMRLLEKSPAQRPPSGAAVVEVLRSLEAPIVKRPPQEASIAVLPFTSMSDHPQNEYFSEGISDDVIIALTGIRGLKVAARASAFTFKGKHADLATIGEKLGVRSVLQGSVRRSGNRIRLTVQLMNTRDGYQLWSERYDRELEDIFAVQDEIATNIVEHVQRSLGLKDAAPMVVRDTDDLEAYQLYVRGRDAVPQGTPSAVRRALDYFRMALSRDPNYARAHVGLAEAYLGLGAYQHLSPADARRQVEASLANAERLQPNASYVHLLRAQLKLHLRRDWASAGDDLARALQRDPNDALTYVYLSYLRGLLGDWKGCREASRKAITLDPLSPFTRAMATIGFLSTDDPDTGAQAALKENDATLELDPNSVLTLWLSAVRLGELGRLDEAISRALRAVELTQRSSIVLGILGRLLAMHGRRDEVNPLLDELAVRARTEYVGPIAHLLIELALGDEDRIANAVQRNVDEGTGTSSLTSTGASRDLDRLVSHPRLGPLVRQLNLYAERPRLAPVAASSGGIDRS